MSCLRIAQQNVPPVFSVPGVDLSVYPRVESGKAVDAKWLC